MEKRRIETAIILPIHPVYVNRIKLGTKRVEFRAKIWDKRSQIQTVYIYETTPTSAIVGYFEIADIIRGSPDEVYKKAGMFAGINYETYKKYSENQKLMNGILIKYPVFFESPIPFDLIKEGMKAPQAFFYCDSEMSDRILNLADRKNGSSEQHKNVESCTKWLIPEEAIILKYISEQKTGIGRNNIH